MGIEVETVEPGATVATLSVGEHHCYATGSVHESARTTLTDVQVRTADGDLVATMTARGYKF
jgi:acyl-coenzyme A thioesterase PaaI-like protein